MELTLWGVSCDGLGHNTNINIETGSVYIYPTPDNQTISLMLSGVGYMHHEPVFEVTKVL